jgi:hypothetical protein
MPLLILYTTTAHTTTAHTATTHSLILLLLIALPSSRLIPPPVSRLLPQTTVRAISQPNGLLMASHAATAAASPHPLVQSSTIKIASGQVAATANAAAKVPPPVLTTPAVGITAPMMIVPNIKATSAVDAVGISVMATVTASTVGASTVGASTVTASTVGASTMAHLVSHEEQGPVTKKSKLN